ncbi:MAG: DNA-binding NarL/FixJ family response regulator [Planctomycetota bacterium]|jgi:DNA-binding NarL/FixJ family response regulator
MTRAMVLLDDDPVMSICIERALRKTDWELTSFLREELALEHLAHSTPDVLFVDERLPVRDGHELMQELIKIEHLSKTRLVLFSSVAPPSDVRELVQALGATVVSKDIILTPTELLSFLNDSPESSS